MASSNSALEQDAADNSTIFVCRCALLKDRWALCVGTSTVTARQIQDVCGRERETGATCRVFFGVAV